jgi:transketolase
MDLFTVGPEHHGAQDAGSDQGLRAIAAFVRINALSCIVSAQHGWLGASFSCAEMLTALYFGLGERQVVLSKGHAAAAQYACLFGLGALSRDQLLAYKDGPDAPQAHSSRGTPGVLLHSGSLGQAPSQVAGMVAGGARGRFFVVLGDGEMQEGQVWEALQTIAHRRLVAIDILVDMNGWQSARQVSAVKGIADLGKALQGLGFQVFELDGHDPLALVQVLEPQASRRPRVVICRTHKAGGSRFTVPEGEVQPWHGRVPDAAAYRGILGEQAALASDPGLSQAVRVWLSGGPSLPARRPPSSGLSTRDASAQRLEQRLADKPELCVLDADLADSCGLGRIADPRGPFARRGQFFQLGISEQDMVSFAGGLALEGRLPWVSTYAAFMTRAVEQVRANSSMDARVVYAGNYAGLCYFSDGRSHQSLDDGAHFVALPGISVLEPATPEQAAAQVDWAIDAAPGSVYLRLHRTPQELPGLAPLEAADPLSPLVRGLAASRMLVAAGPVSARLALDCLQHPDFAGWGLVVVSCFDPPTALDGWRTLLGSAETLVVVEDAWAPGVLRPWIDGLLVDLGHAPRRLVLQPRGFGSSFRSLEACLAHFGFTVEAVRALVAAAPGRC